MKVETCIDKQQPTDPEPNRETIAVNWPRHTPFTTHKPLQHTHTHVSRNNKEGQLERNILMDPKKRELPEKQAEDLMLILYRLKVH